jgi:hypothetical protein
MRITSTGSHPVVPVYPEARAGSPGEQIGSAAQDGDAGLIIIPARGLTGLKRFVIGSVAERVIRHAPCPVLVLRNKETGPAAGTASGKCHRPSVCRAASPPSRKKF